MREGWFRLSAAVALRQVDGDYLAYNPACNETLLVSAPAFQLLCRLRDGACRAADLTAEAKADLSDAELAETLRLLAAKGLIEQQANFEHDDFS